MKENNVYLSTDKLLHGKILMFKYLRDSALVLYCFGFGLDSGFLHCPIFSDERYTLQSLNPSRNLNTCFIIFTLYLIVLDFCILLSISFLVFFHLFIYSHALWNFGAWSL